MIGMHLITILFPVKRDISGYNLKVIELKFGVLRIGDIVSFLCV